MEGTHRARAEWLRSLISNASATPAVVRSALTSVPPAERDAWIDRVFGLDSIASDGPELPRGCVPYLPCPVDALLRVVEHAEVRASDVFVDVGSGVGRASALVHLLTGAQPGTRQQGACKPQESLATEPTPKIVSIQIVTL